MYEQPERFSLFKYLLMEINGFVKAVIHYC